MSKHKETLPTTRSIVGNGTRLFPTGTKLTTAAYRRFKDIYLSITDDLGGIGSLTEAQIQLCRRAAGLSLQAEQMEARWVTGGRASLSRYVACTNALNRLLNTIGIERKMRDVSPD